MKSTLGLIIIAVVVLTLAPVDGIAQYYYSDNREIPLGVDSTKVLVKLANLDGQDASDWAGGIGRIDQLQEDHHIIDGFNAFSLDSAVGQEPCAPDFLTQESGGSPPRRTGEDGTALRTRLIPHRRAEPCMEPHRFDDAFSRGSAFVRPIWLQWVTWL